MPLNNSITALLTAFTCLVSFHLSKILIIFIRQLFILFVLTDDPVAKLPAA